MKKLLSLVLIALVSVSAMFAESYDELLAKAKSYEAKKEWVYAMGYYYDAAFAENAQEEAQQKFDALSAEIANGNPGFGKFNVFSLYDEWVNLVKNFVKYFTEFSPYSVWYDGELVLKETDYKAKKATYDMKCSLVPTQKFRYIEYALQEGYKKSKKDDWTGFWVLQRSSFSAETPFPKFPSKFSTIQDKYDKLLISIIDSRKSSAADSTVESLKTELKNEIKRIYNEEGMAVVAWPSISIPKLSFMRSHYGENSGLLEIKEVYANFGKYSSGDVSAGYETNFYDVQFGLYDKEGKLLVKGTRQNTYSVLEPGTEKYTNQVEISMGRNLENFKNSRGSYSFPGITQDIMEVIVSGEVIVKPIGVFLNYGAIFFGDYDSDNPRAVLKPLPDIAIAKDKVNFVSLEEIRLESLKRVEEKRLESLKRVEKMNIEMIKIPGKNFEMLKTEVTQELYESVMGENPSWFQLGNEELKKEEKESLQKICGGDTSKLPVEQVSWYDAIYFCNKLSEMKGLKPVYSVNGETETSKWGYKPHKGESIKSEIVQDKNANGFCLPTYEEWEYAALGGQNYKYAGSDNLDEVAWYDDNSDGVPHPTATKKPNGGGLYDMSGNVCEWVWDPVQVNPAFRYNRGGSYDVAGRCEVSVRGGFNADGQDCSIGFRLLRQTEQ